MQELLLWMVLVWQITHDSPSFLPAKLSRYTVCFNEHTSTYVALQLKT